jgi:hypothetical protein
MMEIGEMIRKMVKEFLFIIKPMIDMKVYTELINKR